jgi:hypothetical protein
VSAIEVDFGSSNEESGRATRSIADQMKAALAARRQASARVERLHHDAVPEVEITCRVPSDGEEIAELAQRAEKRAKGSGASSVWFNRLLLARLTTEIRWHGETLTDSDGNAWTFASPGLHDLVEASDAPSAVARLYGSDAYVAALASQLMDLGGFGNSAAVEVVEDPTTSR